MSYLDEVRERFEILLKVFSKNREYINENCRRDSEFKIASMGHTTAFFYIRVYKKDTIEFYEKSIEFLEKTVANQEEYIENFKTPENVVKF